MRLIRSIHALYHSALASWHYAASERHGTRADAILADIRLRRLAGSARTADAAGRVLLASIVGLFIAGLWFWICARAGR